MTGSRVRAIARLIKSAVSRDAADPLAGDSAPSAPGRHPRLRAPRSLMRLGPSLAIAILILGLFPASVLAVATDDFLVESTLSVTAGTAADITVTAYVAGTGMTTVDTGYGGTVHFASTDGAAVLPGNYTFQPGDSGVHPFTGEMTLKTVGSGTQTVTVTDNIDPGNTGTSAAITVGPAGLDHFAINTIPSQIAGVAFAVTATAKDLYNNTVTSYTGTPTLSNNFSGTGPNTPVAGTFPAVVGGVGTSNGDTIDFTAESGRTVTVTDTGKFGTSTAFTVGPDVLDHFAIASIPSQTAGVAFAVTATAKDLYNNTITSYVGTPTLSNDFSSTGGVPIAGTFPAFVGGVGTSNGDTIDFTAESGRTVTVTDGIITGTSTAFTVGPAGLDHFVVGAIPSQTAGVAFAVTATAKDVHGNTDTNYVGTPTLSNNFSSTGGVPVAGTFPAFVGGVGTSSGTIDYTAESLRTVTVTDTGKTGTSGAFTVGPAGLDHFAIASIPSQTAGVAFAVTATAKDAFNNTVTSYTGTPTLSNNFSSTGGAPHAGTFPAFSGGVGTSNSDTIDFTAESGRTVTVTDTGKFGTFGTFTVHPATADHLVVTAPVSVGLGAPFTVTVTAKDAFNNTATGYLGTIHFTSSDIAATLPADYPFLVGDNGVKTFTNGMAFGNVGGGTQTITATDTITFSITGNSGPVTVTGNATSNTTVSSGTNPSIFGGSVIFTATVTGAGATPTGPVDFLDGVTLLGTGTLDPTGHATFTTSSLTAAHHSITAEYLGDNNYATSTSTAVDQLVNPLPIQVTADSGQSKVAGTADPVFTYTITSGTLVGSDAFSGVLSRVAGEAVGAYAITQGTLALSANYSLSFVSADFSITPAPTAPGKPTGVSGVGFDGAAVVSWAAPADDGGNPINVYAATSSPGGITCYTVALTCTVTGLSNHTAYTFTVTASNSIATGAPSDPSRSVIPRIGASFVPLTPSRILDTYAHVGLSASLTHHHAVTFAVTNQFPGDAGRNVPSTATAITGVLSVSRSTALGYLALTPTPTDYPTISTLNFPSGDARSSGVTVPLSPTGTLSLTYVGTAGRTAEASLDITGYFLQGSSGSTYFALTPNRILDSRTTNGNMSGGLTAGTHRTFQVTGRSSDASLNVPSAAVAVTGNITVTNQLRAGFLTIGPNPDDAPGTASLYFPAYVPSKDNRATGVTIKLGAGGTLNVTYTAAPGSTANVIFDVTGFFVPGSAGAMYVPVTPNRIVDSRKAAHLGLKASLIARRGVSFMVVNRSSDGTKNIPSSAVAVTGTLTVTNQKALGYLALTKTPTNVPTTSTLNFLYVAPPGNDNRATGVTVPLGPGGIQGVCYWATVGKTTDVIFDVTGYFVQ